MQFILKLFKALNSAQSAWQVTLAITLGMVAGLTPMSGIQTFVILFLAFVLNIHLGLFFVASGVFAGIGYLFDPLFEQVGYALLTNDVLQGLWTTWYNDGLMRLSHFDNTLVMGSTVVALVLAIPLYFLLGWLITHYRDSLGRFLEKYPKLGLFGILKATTKKDRLLRWWGAGLFIVIAALLSAFALFAAGPLLKWGIEYGGSKALQRDVRVGSVDIDFLEGAVGIDTLEVAGSQEGVDAVSMKRIGFDIALNALLFDKTHIEHVAVKGMGFDTNATLKKSAVDSTAKEQAEADQASVGPKISMPSLKLPDPKTLLAEADLKSLKIYDEADQEVKAIRARWEKVAKTEFSANSVDEFKQDYKAIKAKAASKDPKQLLALAKDIKAFKAKIDARTKRISELQKEFKADQKRISALSAKVKNAPSADYNALKSTYSLDGNGAMNVVGLLFGEKVKHYLALGKKYHAMIAPYLESDKVTKEEAKEETLPPRGEGRWIRFKETVPSPDLLIARTDIDGILKDQAFTALIKDISDDQKALGRTLTFVASSDGPQVKGLTIQGEDDRLGKVVKDSATFDVRQVRLDSLDLSSMRISRSDLALKGDISLVDNSVLDGKSHLDFSDAAISMEGLEGKSAKAVSEVLSSIRDFGADVDLAGELESPKVSVSTDLDKKLSGALSANLKKQAAGYQKELKGLLDAKMKEQLGAFNSEAGQIVDINALAGDQSKLLGDLGADAGGLGKGGESLKGLLSF